MFSQSKRKRGKIHEAIVPIPGCCHAPRQQKSFLVNLDATSFSFVRQCALAAARALLMGCNCAAVLRHELQARQRYSLGNSIYSGVMLSVRLLTRALTDPICPAFPSVLSRA
jgi:hypothetical protein